MTVRRCVALVIVSAMFVVGSVGLVPGSASADESLPLREGDTGALVQALQADLTWLGYSIHASNLADGRLGLSTIEAVNEFRLKYGLLPNDVVTKATLDRVSKVAGTPGRLPRRCTEVPKAICIDMGQKLLRLVVDGDVQMTTDARFGQPGEETRTGTFKVYRKHRTHVSTAFDSPMPFSLFFSGAQAIHYSGFFAQDGYAGASHGCINLRDRAKARWLFDRAPLGTPVIVYS